MASFALACALLIPAPADAGISIKVAVNSSTSSCGTNVSSVYRNGDCPISGAACPTGYTCAGVGNGTGEIDEVSASSQALNVVGSSTIQNMFMAYKDAGAGDVQILAEIQNDYAGNLAGNTSIGVGLREGTTSTSYFFQCFAPHALTSAVQSNYGTAAGAFTNVNGLAGQSRPRWVAATYDVSATDLRCHESADGTTWTQVSQTTRTMSDVLAYVFGASGSSTASMSGTTTDFEFATTIDVYTPENPPGGGEPVWDTPISNQSWPEDTAISSVDVAANCSISQGVKSFSGSGLPTGISISSAGVISGTPSTAGSGNAIITCSDGTNGTDDTFSWVVTPAAGDTFNISSTTTSYNCNSNGVGPGDTLVLLGSGGGNTRGELHLSNCFGSAGNMITVRNDTTAAAPLNISTTGSSGFRGIDCLNCQYIDITGEGKWVGATAESCGMSDWPNRPSAPQCGIRITVASGTPTSQNKWRGSSRNFTVRGVEFNGTNGAAGLGLNVGDSSYLITQHPGEFREGMLITNNYFVNIARESLYVGPNYSVGGNLTNELTLRDNEISYNLIVNSGYDALSVKSTTEGDTQVHHNLVDGAGTSLAASSTGNSGACLDLFEGGYITFHSNWVEDCVGPGILVSFLNSSRGTVPFEANNNVIIRAGDNDPATAHNKQGIQIGANAGSRTQPVVRNNTIIDATGVDINVSASSITPCSVRDNIATESASLNTGPCSNSNNLSGTTASQNFVDGTGPVYDPRLTSSSPARNTATGPCPTTDFDDVVRGGTCSRGAFE